MIFNKEPNLFFQKFWTAAGVMLCDGKILILFRSETSQQPLTWCLPGGKRDEQNLETVSKTVSRETEEETGIFIPTWEWTYLETFFVRYPNVDFRFSMFLRIFEEIPRVCISDEHLGFAWVPLRSVHRYPLIPELLQCLDIVTKKIP